MQIIRLSFIYRYIQRKSVLIHIMHDWKIYLNLMQTKFESTISIIIDHRSYCDWSFVCPGKKNDKCKAHHTFKKETAVHRINNKFPYTWNSVTTLKYTKNDFSYVTLCNVTL